MSTNFLEGLPTTIDGVLEELDRLVDRARLHGHRTGYFAALYRTVTRKVKEGIAEGFFEHGPRMAELDVIFANRYLSAASAFARGTATTRSWEVAFQATRQRGPLVLQQLLVGMNAHINLDLGIASAQVAPRAKLAGLRLDFDRINEVLASLLDEVKSEVGRISPLIAVLERAGGLADDEVVRFSIDVARTQAWWFAKELAPLPRNAWGGPIGARDSSVARLASTVLRPGLLRFPIAVVRAAESNNVQRNIDILCGLKGPDLSAVDARVKIERATQR